MEDNQSADICRVCRCEGTPDKPLYHPCICTGSIKYIHQECLMQWLKYSEKEFCELCNYRFSFIPIYSPDMPQRLPLKDIFSVIARCLGTVARYWLQYTLVAIAWLVIIPLTAYRIYMFLFNYSFDDILSFTFEFSKTENLFSDGFYGCCVVMCTLCTFIFLIWLREQIIRVGAPDWLERPLNFRIFQALFRVPENVNNLNEPPQPQENDPLLANNNNDDEDNEDDIDMNDAEDDNDVDTDGEAEVNVVEQNENNEQEVAQPNQVAANQVAVAQDWNPVIEWDRGGEDITWERILGLDGTFAFLENVFWVITLNTLFILIFAYCPYHIGNLVFRKLNSEKTLVSSQFDRFVIIFMGYLMIGFMLFFLHAATSLTRFSRLQRFFGFCYIIVKVALLVTLEIGLFPTVVGWWLDICSLPLFGTTLQNRIDNFYTSPGTSLFIHWLVGMICIFYFVSFVLMIKESLRPGILWFIRNLNDPNFNPVNEMIHLPILSHLQRCVISLVIFCSVVLLVVYLPIATIQKLFPDFLPYNNVSNNESPFELILELFVFRILLPNIIEANDYTFRQLIKSSIKNWCHLFSYILDLKSYLLGDNQNENEINDDHLDDLTSQNYHKPKFFIFRVTLLILSFCSTLFLFGVFMLTIPILTGRDLLDFINTHVDISDIRVNEFYTAAIGIYGNLVLIQAANRLVEWVREITRLNSAKIAKWFSILCKLTISGILLFGVIPLLVGILFDVVILMPLRVPLNQTPILYLWQDYAFGILLTNVICVINMMADVRFKDIMEQIYNNGLANTNLQLIIFELAIPNISLIGLVLAVPYVSVNTLLPLFRASFELQNMMNRRIHSALFILALVFFFCKYQINKFISFYEHIRNDKYLVGRRLVNYDHSKSSSK